MENMETGIDGVTRDKNLDVASLLTSSTAAERKEEPVEEKPKSALDLAIARKANGAETGMLVDADKDVVETEELRANTDTEEFREGFKQEVTEQEDLTDKAKLVYAIRQPANEGEYAQMITEISMVYQDANGVVHIPENARWIMPKTPENTRHQTVNTNVTGTYPEAVNVNGTSVEVSSEAVLANARKEKKDQLVKILIDKTGLGANIKFDEEETKAIQTSDMIHLVEVENRDLEVVEIERPDDGTPFMQLMDSYKLSVSKAPMTFPASGFKADITGLSWGEFADITLDISDDSEDYINFDKIYKKLSVIYNNMKNISIGAFKSFEDFLKHFAYVDVQLATYGLLIATQPEEDTITLMCNKPSCKQRFNFKYVPRSIINFNNANTEMLQQIDRINTVAPEERLRLAKASRVNKFTRFKLPASGYLVDLGFASCYDYLYGILSLIKKYTDEELPQNDTRWELTGMLQGVRAIYIPQANGTYIAARRPEDIVDVLKDAILPEDIIVLNSAYEHYINQYYIDFSLSGVECPHCHTKTENIQITPDELVFLIHQRQRSTPITFDNFQDF